MTETQATVIASDGAYAIVRAEQQGGCGRCNEPGGCGGNNLVQMMCASPRQYRVLNPEGAKIGDVVTVSISEGVVGRSALIMYGLPLVFLFVGTIFSGLLSDSNWLAVVCGGVGFAVSWKVIARIQRGAAGDERFQPTIHLPR